MIKLNKLIKGLLDVRKERGKMAENTSPRAMSIRVSASWRKYDACKTYTPEFSEREELAADIIINAALALRQQGCKNIEQVIKDRIAWRLTHKD